MSYKQRFLIFIFLFTLLGSSGLYLASSLKQTQQKDVEPEVEGTQDFSSAPEIINVAPIEAIVGQGYRYDVAVVDEDTLGTDLILQLTDAPIWISHTGLAIFGTPTESDLGTHSVTFTITDGENTVTEQFYIVVRTSDEGSN
jgi:hypothetical protein